MTKKKTGKQAVCVVEVIIEDASREVVVPFYVQDVPTEEKRCVMTKKTGMPQKLIDEF